MTLRHPIWQLGNQPVVDFRPGDKVDGTAIYRLVEEDENDDEGERYRSYIYTDAAEVERLQSQRRLVEELLQQVDPATMKALVIGSWRHANLQAPQGFLEALVAQRLPALRTLFVGDMLLDEEEISWIQQGDYTDLIAAYPQLADLTIRGAHRLVLPAMEYPSLSTLTLESAGLSSGVLDALADSRLPQLVGLELWLGSEYGGFDGDLSSCVQLLQKIEPQRLTYLGLRNAELADELAEYLARQDWLGRLETLDLSMGALGDAGAEALCASPYLAGLKVLDLRYTFISPHVLERLERLPLTLVINQPRRGPARVLYDRHFE